MELDKTSSADDAAVVSAGAHTMTPRQSDVPAKIVGGLFFVAMIGQLMLFGRGYYTLVLILTGVMCGIGVFTFTYDRSKTLSGLTIAALIGLLSLLVQGYQTLFLVIVLTVWGIGALAFLYYDGSHVWSWWFPDQPINPTVKRWLRYLLQAITAGLAYVQARFYINMLTGVDPGNFPTALTALAVLNTLLMWLVVIPTVFMVMSTFYALARYVASILEKIGFTETPGVSRRRWGFRAFGSISLAFIVMAAYGLPADTLFMQRAMRIFVSHVLVAADFSYDRTCAVSSEHRLVAQLKDRREIQVSRVSIAEEGAAAWFIFRNFTFSIGTCVDQIQP
jgi:hypothetical protein